MNKNKDLHTCIILTLNLLNFLNGLVHFYIFGTVHYQTWGYQDEDLKLAC